MNRFVLTLVSLAAGIGLGTFIPDSSATLETGGANARSSAPVQAALAGATVRLDIEPIRAVIREELNAALAGSQREQASQQPVQATNSGSHKVSTGGPTL